MANKLTRLVQENGELFTRDGEYAQNARSIGKPRLLKGPYIEGYTFRNWINEVVERKSPQGANSYVIGNQQILEESNAGDSHCPIRVIPVQYYHAEVKSD